MKKMKIHKDKGGFLIINPTVEIIRLSEIADDNDVNLSELFLCAKEQREILDYE